MVVVTMVTVMMAMMLRHRGCVGAAHADDWRRQSKCNCEAES
jgi:hypothetical protein